MAIGKKNVLKSFCLDTFKLFLYSLKNCIFIVYLKNCIFIYNSNASKHSCQQPWTDFLHELQKEQFTEKQ